MIWQGSTTSQEFLVLVARLFELSKRSAAKADGGNYSSFTFAGLPMLLAALQALVVEYEYLLNPLGVAPPPDINGPDFLGRYRVSGQLLDDFNDLIELRNEIIHPAHVPTGTPDNWPAYLGRVKDLGLLNTTGTPGGDYALFDQLASHRLFEWAIGVVRSLYGAVIMSDASRAPMFIGFYKTFESDWFKKLPEGALW
jgi:hypothetical protein